LSDCQTYLVSDPDPEQKNTCHGTLPGDSAAGYSVEDHLILREGKMNLFKELHLLAEPMREVMYLRLTGEFSFREIGEILGKTKPGPG
jgi:RNA polymerase sigma-70 factor (ECF subfamily)